MADMGPGRLVKPDTTLFLCSQNAPGQIGCGSEYGIDRLVWFEVHDLAETALRREKQIKEWKRDSKINLIEHENRHWIDLFPSLTI